MLDGYCVQKSTVSTHEPRRELRYPQCWGGNRKRAQAMIVNYQVSCTYFMTQPPLHTASYGTVLYARRYTRIYDPIDFALLPLRRLVAHTSQRPSTAMDAKRSCLNIRRNSGTDLSKSSMAGSSSSHRTACSARFMASTACLACSAGHAGLYHGQSTCVR